MKMSKQRTFLIVGVVAVSLVSAIVGGYITHEWFGQTTKSSISSAGTVTKDSVALAEVIKEVSPSVVSITTSDQSAGSGIVLSSDGLIMTNKHVAESDEVSYSVVMSDGKIYKNAKVLARDPYNDVAFLKVDAKNLLSQVDGELDLTFREKVISKVNKNYREVKGALANRNKE